MVIRIILAEDHALMREGLRALIENVPDMEVVGEAGDGREAIRLIRKLCPDVVIMDVSMPGLNGIDATSQILGEEHPVRIIALSMHSDRRFVEKMLKAGASGYLLKNCASKELVFAVRAVSRGGSYLSPGVAGGIVKEYLALMDASEEARNREPTGREREIIQMIAEGAGTRDIAQRLNLSPKTVESHRRRVMEKLNLGSIAELTKYAIREGLTELD